MRAQAQGFCACVRGTRACACMVPSVDGQVKRRGGRQRHKLLGAAPFVALPVHVYLQLALNCSSTRYWRPTTKRIEGAVTLLLLLGMCAGRRDEKKLCYWALLLWPVGRTRTAISAIMWHARVAPCAAHVLKEGVCTPPS